MRKSVSPKHTAAVGMVEERDKERITLIAMPHHEIMTADSKNAGQCDLPD